MYSALQAEVPVSKETMFNDKILQSLLKSEKIYIAGQALSHCVNYTVRDIVDNWPKDQTSKICILVDCASSVSVLEYYLFIYLP